MVEGKIDQLYQTIMKYDADQSKVKLLEWMKTVTQKKFGLVDILVATFNDASLSNDHEKASRLLKVLKKLNEFLPEIVQP